MNPIIDIISLIGSEIVKSAGKDIAVGIGDKASEMITSFREPLTELGISNFDDRHEIQEKLDAKPGIKAELEAKVDENKEEFDEIIRSLKQNPNIVTNKFHSENNEKVINIGNNSGNINM